MSFSGFPEGASWPNKERLIELADRYRDLLNSKGRSPGHVAEVHNQILKLLGMAAYQLDADSISIAVGKFRADSGVSLRTCNKYLQSAKSFTRWLARPSKQLIPFDPLGEIAKFNVKKDRRHERTAFSDSLLAALLTATRSAKHSYRGIAGADRAELYHAAAATGIREETLGLLEVGQFDLPPKAVGLVRVRAEQMKDDQPLDIPIQPESAAQMRRYFAGKMPTAKAFKVPPHKWDFIRMLRKDLLIAEVSYCREIILPNGRSRRMDVLDFHSLRHTYGTWLAKNNVPLTTAQKWMGHSDPSLTANIYSHVVPADAMAAMNRLPPLAGVVLAG